MDTVDLRRGDIVLIEAEVTLPSSGDYDIYLRVGHQNLLVDQAKVRLLRPVLEVGEVVVYVDEEGECIGTVKAVADAHVWIKSGDVHEIVHISKVTRRPQTAPEPAPAL